MPNNDLGTAHGKVRVDFDTKGSAGAAAALTKMSAQFEQMNKKLSGIEKALTDADRGLAATSREMERTTKATKGMSSSMFDGRKSVKAFGRDTMDLVNDLQALAAVAQVAKKKFDSLNGVLQFLNRAGGASSQGSIFKAMSIGLADVAARNNKIARSFANAQRAILGNLPATNRRYENSLLGVRSAFTLLGSGIFIVRNKILGVNTALDNAPSWIQKMNRLTQRVGILGLAFTGVARAMKPLRSMEKFANTALFGNLIKGSRGAAKQMQIFGNITEKVFGKRIGAGMVRSLLKTEGSLTSFLKNGSVGISKFSASLRGAGINLTRLAKDSGSLVAGMALLARSSQNLWHRFQWFFKLPKPILAGAAILFSRVLPGAMSYFGKALVGVSNLVVGLWDGIKQLGGAATIIPGLVATAGIIGSVFFGVFKGIGDKFKDIFSDDPLERSAALQKLPDHLKPLGQAIIDVKGRWTDFQKVLQTNAFIGIDKNIRELADAYFPVLTKGAGQVVTSIRKIKDAFVGFALEGQTKSDVSAMYNNTAGSLLNVAKATKPVAEGFRDLAVVGTSFIKGMSGFLPGLSAQFATWAKTNRENGNAMKWMQDATSGAYDLVHGLKSLTQAAYSVLGLFKTNTGDNFLQRFADWADRLNARVESSKAVGWLAKIRTAIHGIGEEKLDDMKDLFKALGNDVLRIVPFITSLSDSFSGKFIPALKFSMEIVSRFLDIVNDLGATQLLGWILGAAGAMTLLPKVFATALTAAQGFFGFILVMANKGKVLAGLNVAILAVASTLSRMGEVGASAATGLINVSSASQKAIGFLGGLISKLSIAAIAVYAFYEAYSSASDDQQAFDNQIKTNTKNIVAFREALNKAFTSDGGLTGSNVMSTISSGLDQMVADMQDTASKAPSWIDHIMDPILNWKSKQNANSDSFFGSFQESDIINSQQETASAAQNVIDKFNELKEKGVDLGAVIKSTDGDFKKFADTQRSSGQAGSDFINELAKRRQALKDIEDDFKRVGPGGVQLASGIQQIAEAGGDATAKLNGLKAVLEALGILQTNSLDAMAAYEQGLDDLSSKVTDVVSSADGFDKSKLMSGDTFNTGEQAGRDFLNVMEQLGNEFMANVSAGADASAEYAKFHDRLQDISTQTGLTIQDLEQLGRQVGLDKNFVNITAQLVNKDQMTRDLFQVMLRMQQMVQAGPLQVPVELKVPDPGALNAKLDEIFGTGANDVGDVVGTNYVIRPGIDQAKLAKVIQVLTDAGINFSNTSLDAPTPANPPELPIVPALPPPGAVPASTRPLNEPDAPVPPPAAQAAPAAPAVDTAAIDDAKGKIDELAAKIAEINGKGFDIVIPHTIVDAAQEIVSALNDIKNKIAELPGAFGSAVASIVGAMNAMAEGAYTQGLKFSGTLAQGIIDGSAKAFDAASALASGIKSYFHSSPPKQGPLSTHGDAAKYAGGMFVSSYAAGMSGNGAATGAARGMAGGVISAAMGAKTSDKNTKFLGQISDLLSFGSNLTDAIGKIADSVFGIIKFISDPMGKGTFFGKQPGSAFGWSKGGGKTGKEAQDAEDERLQKKLEDKKSNAAKTPEEQAKDDQAKKDAEKQALLTSDAIDKVIAGDRVAPPTQAEKDAQKKADSASDKAITNGVVKGVSDKGNVTTSQAPLTPDQIAAKAAKSEGDFATTAQQAAADLSTSLDALTPEELARVQSGEISIKTQDQILAELKKQTPLLGDVIDVSQDPNSTEEKSQKALNDLAGIMDAQGEAKTPAQKKQMEALTGIQSTIEQNSGLSPNQNPIDQAQSLVGAGTDIASQIFGAAQSFIEAVGATKDIGDTLVRGVANTEDVMRLIDDVQVYIDYAAKVIGAAGSIASTIGSMTGGADMGITSGIGQIASLISGALQTVNAVIDLGQEAYRIIGSYVGEFLGSLIGGAGGAIGGDAKFLLDTQTNQLLAYGADNPQDKRVHDGVGGSRNLDSRNQLIGNVNVYGGPGSDPRDNTRQMMYQIKASQMAQPVSQ